MATSSIPKIVYFKASLSVGFSSEKKKKSLKSGGLFTAFRSASGPRSPAAAGGSGWSAGRSAGEKNMEYLR